MNASNASKRRPAGPATVIAIYRVQPDREAQVLEPLNRHHPTLHGAGLVTDEPPTVYKNVEKGRPTYFEIFDWIDADAPRHAHETPEVMAIWEPMGACVEDRDGRPKFEFPHVERVALAPSGA